MASEFVDQIHSEEELVTCGSVVISSRVPRVVETHLRPQHHAASEVLGGIKCILRVFTGDSRALALFIIEEVGTESCKELRIELAVHVVHSRILRSCAPQLPCQAEGSIRSKLRRH